MDKQEYKDYQESVSDFSEREGITNLTSEHSEERDHCLICGEELGIDPFFSWRSCECCGSHLGGNREHASGYNPKTKEGQCYDVCEDCLYYAEYGQLGDMTMLDIEADNNLINGG